MNLIHTTLSHLNYERCRSCKDIKGIVISAAVTFYLPIFLSLCNSDYPIEMQRVILQYFPLGLPFPSLFSFHQKTPSRNLTPLLPTRIFDFITEIWVCISILICNIFLCIFYKIIIQRSHALDHTACLPHLHRDTFCVSPLIVSL